MLKTKRSAGVAGCTGGRHAAGKAQERPALASENRGQARSIAKHCAKFCHRPNMVSDGGPMAGVDVVLL